MYNRAQGLGFGALGVGSNRFVFVGWGGLVHFVV